MALWMACLPLATIEAAELRVDINGIEGELIENARAHLSMQRYVDRDVSAAQVRLLYQQAPEELRAALRPYGYYHAEVTSELNETGQNDFHAVFRVEPGNPVIVRDVRTRVQGPAADLAEVQAALEQFQLHRGERLVHAAYENGKAAIDQAMREAGFFSAELVRHRLAVNPTTHSAEIDLVWQSGERYRLGQVNFADAPFREGFLQGYVPWQRGDDYDADAVLKLQRRLIETEYFEVVSVQPDLSNVQSSRQVPVDVLLRPDERTLYTAALFASTDTGPGGRVGVERRWINRRGHKASGELEYSSRLQEASLQYQIPQPGPYRRNYGFGAAYTDEETNSSVARMTSVAAVNARERWYGFDRTLGLQYVESNFEIGGERRRSDLLYAEGGLTRRVADDEIFPRTGYSLDIVGRASAGGWLSDTHLLSLRVRGKWITSLSDVDRLLLRGEVGAMTVGDFADLPPRLRFFAGGDRSIRGFDYQEIGARTSAGRVIGGKYLAVASVEYERYFFGDWGAALFVDAGDAFTRDYQTHVGAGIGVRWQSPIGVVRLDLAHAVRSDVAEGWRIHLMIGPDL